MVGCFKCRWLMLCWYGVSVVVLCNVGVTRWVHMIEVMRT